MAKAKKDTLKKGNASKKEDDEITERGWKTNRPEDAYEQLGIVLKDVR